LKSNHEWQPNAHFGFTPRPPGALALSPKLDGDFTEAFDDGTIYEIARITI